MKLKGKAKQKARAKAKLQLAKVMKATGSPQNIINKTLSITPWQVENEFRPDFGMKCAEIGKTSYRLSVEWFAKEILQNSLSRMPHRSGEYTMGIPFEGAEYCATFRISDDVWAKMGKALSTGNHMVLSIRPGKVEECGNGEMIRVVDVMNVQIHKDRVATGGNFMVATFHNMNCVNKTMKELADCWNNVTTLEVA